MKEDFDSLVDNLKKCEICKERFGFQPHPIFWGSVNLDNFYIASLAHCYPGKDKNGNDRIPPKICYETWVKRELEYINNMLYIIVGAKSAKIFFPDENFNDLIFKNNFINGKLAIVLPHPSPLNIKWFKDHPEFMKERIFQIRKIINEVLYDK